MSLSLEGICLGSKCLPLPSMENSTRCMSLSLVGFCLESKCLPLPSMGITNTSSGRLWCLVGKFCCVGKTQSGIFLSMSSVNVKVDNFSLFKASIVTIAEPSLPLLISSPQRLTAWWCRFICILFRVRLLHLRSICGALSDPPHKGYVADPVVWLNRLVCLSVCIVSVLYFRTCTCSLKVTFGMDQNVLLSWAWARGSAVGCCVWESGCAARSGVSCNFCQSL